MVRDWVGKGKTQRHRERKEGGGASLPHRQPHHAMLGVANPYGRQYRGDSPTASWRGGAVWCGFRSMPVASPRRFFSRCRERCRHRAILFLVEIGQVFLQPLFQHTSLPLSLSLSLSLSRSLSFSLFPMHACTQWHQENLLPMTVYRTPPPSWQNPCQQRLLLAESLSTTAPLSWRGGGLG